MPVYEYKCASCGAVFEKLTRFTQGKGNPPCPVCESKQTDKLISRVSHAAEGGDSSSLNCDTCGTAPTRSFG